MKTLLEYNKTWLAGFLDGEGCFVACYTSDKNFCVSLSINLRADDINILKMISSTFGNIGNIHEYSSEYVSKFDKTHRNAVAMFKISNISMLYENVITLLDEYPLLSKKRKDYIIWRRIIELLYQTKHKKFSRNKVKEEIIELVDKLHKIKKYQEI